MAEHRSRHRSADTGSVRASDLIDRLTSGIDVARPSGHRHAAVRPAFAAVPALAAGSFPGFALPALAMPSLPSGQARRTMIAAVSAGALGVTAAIAATAGPVAQPTSGHSDIQLATGSAAAAFSLPGSDVADAPPAAVTGADLAAGVLPSPVAVPVPSAASTAALAASAAPESAAVPVAPGATVAAEQDAGKVTDKVAELAAKAEAANEAAAKAAKKEAAAKGAAVGTAAAAAGGSAAVKAIAFAKSAIGKPYRYGAAGPNAFDCSGLVMSAFKKAGVSLPRSSAAQSRVGTPVKRGDLRPGDLVFFYSPVSHVGIYVGNGKIVHASTSGEPVKISNMGSRPFHNARRL